MEGLDEEDGRLYGSDGATEKSSTGRATETAGRFAPELGQLVYGQPCHTFAIPAIMQAVLDTLDDAYRRVYWNVMQEDCPSPFGNHGTSLVTPVFEVHAYSWGDDEQPFNFKWRDIRLSWYKYSGRGASANMEITPDMAARCLDECLAFIEAMDPDNTEDDAPNFIDLT